MKKEIAEYVQNCQTSQKKREYQKTELEEKVERSEEVWKEMSIDHIMKLSKIKGKDFILIVQNQLSEMIYIKTVSEKETAQEI